MGEYAEMMLDGTCCSSCGDYLGGDEGYPVICASCKREERYEPRVPRFAKDKIKPSMPRADQVNCPVCRKVVKAVGLNDHLRDVHGEKPGHAPRLDLTSTGAATIYIRFSEDGRHMRKWSFEPFDGAITFTRADAALARRDAAEGEA